MLWKQDPGHSEAGFSLITVMMASAVIAVMAGGTVQVLSKKVDAMRIMRMHQRMDLLQQKLENTASSFGAMAQSANLNPSSDLYKCMTQSICNGQDLFLPYDLYDSLGQKMSGLFDLSGRSCKENCPIEIKTEVKLVCDEGAASCAQPIEVQTRYTIKQSNEDIFNGRRFDPVTGVASLVTFTCPAGQYITAVSDEGVIRCEKAVASPNDEKCPAETAAYGLDDKGYLKCMPIDDYCAKPIGLSAVLDVSGSMNSDGKLDAAKQAMSGFLGNMDSAKDQGAFTTFGTEGQLKSGLIKDFGQLKSMVNAERAGGSTNMSAGLEIGAKAVSTFSAGPKVMIFISDGFNTVATDPVPEAAQAKAQGVRIITVGFSKNADRNMLRRIASTPGDYFDASNAGELKKVLEQVGVMTCRGPVKDYGKGKGP